MCKRLYISDAISIIATDDMTLQAKGYQQMYTWWCIRDE